MDGSGELAVCDSGSENMDENEIRAHDQKTAKMERDGSESSSQAECHQSFLENNNK